MNLRLSALSALLAVFVLPIAAPRPAAALVHGFVGPFAPPQWTPLPDASIVDTTSAPAAITLFGPDDGSGWSSDSAYAITLPVDHDSVSFLWSYVTADLSPAHDPLGYLLNSVFTPLSDPFGPPNQSGSIKLVMSSGDSFAFAISSLDNLGGAATTTVSCFKAGRPSEIPDCPGCVCPVPAPLPILGAAAAFGSIRKARAFSSRLKAFPLA